MRVLQRCFVDVAARALRVTLRLPACMRLMEFLPAGRRPGGVFVCRSNRWLRPWVARKLIIKCFDSDWCGNGRFIKSRMKSFVVGMSYFLVGKYLWWGLDAGLGAALRAGCVKAGGGRHQNNRKNTTCTQTNSNLGWCESQEDKPLLSRPSSVILIRLWVSLLLWKCCIFMRQRRFPSISCFCRSAPLIHGFRPDLMPSVPPQKEAFLTAKT